MGKIVEIDCNTERLTNAPKHHLFGFHDLLISNSCGDKYLSMEADCIERPPLPGERFGVGYVKDGSFNRIGETVAFNYPQGARMQWVADSNCFTVNNLVGNNWGTDLYDTTTNQLIDRFTSTTHVLTKDGKFALGLDYSRLNRLGGYGYTGLIDSGSHDPYPSNSGITITNMQTKESMLLVSVRQVAEFGTNSLSGQTHHYLTHLCLNPSSTRVAFLHRYIMPDGGLMTRLMTIGIDGRNLHCLGQGFLSHFNWKDDEHIYIYGRVGNPVDSFRSNPILQNPVLTYALRFAKKCIKRIIGVNNTILNGMCFLLIKDSDIPEVKEFAKDIILGDGHPMTNPINADWCVCDTYPDNEGDRELFLYHFPSNTRLNIGKFKRLFRDPDMTRMNDYFFGTDQNILKTFDVNRLAFTRSGLHCDLHPRWSSDGKWVVFDSIHEGSRQLYRIDTSGLISNGSC